MSPRSDEPTGSFVGRADDPARSERPFQTARSRGLATSRTVDSDDGQWRVYEMESGPYDRRSGPSLIFESDGVLRRVRDYPANWRELSDGELMTISWRR